MAADYFSTVLAPICFGLLSEKAKERSNSILNIRSILPDDVKLGRISVNDAERVMQSYCEWVEFEYRLFRKDASQLDKFQVSLKELKWILSVMSPYIAQVKLQSINNVFTLLLNILNNCSLDTIPESAVIFNTCLLNKPCILRRLSDIPKEIEKLLAVVYRRMGDSDYNSINECLKMSCQIALVIPFDSDFDSEAYQLAFESFINYLKYFEMNRLEPQYLTMLFGTVNSLFLSNYDLVAKYHHLFSKYALLWFRTRNAALLQKLINFFLIKRPVNEEIGSLESFLLQELNDPCCISLHSGHPFKFLDAMSQFKSGQLEYLSAADILKCSFLNLCCELPLKIEIVPPALALCEPFSSNSALKLTSSDPLKSNSFREWMSLAASWLSRSNNFQIESSAFVWLYIEKSDFKNMNFDTIDSFLARFFSGTASISALDPYILKQIGKYFSIRFKDLWWSSTAEDFSRQFSDWLLRSFSENPSSIGNALSNVEWLLAFASCIFSSLGIGPLYIEQQVFFSDSQLFVASLKSFVCFSKNAVHDNDVNNCNHIIFSCIFKSLLQDLMSIALEAGQEIAPLSVLTALVNQQLPEFKTARSDFTISFQLFSKLVQCLPSLLTKFPITELLSNFIPAISILSEKQTDCNGKENFNFTSSVSLIGEEITSNSLQMTRFGHYALSENEQNLYSAIQVCFKLMHHYAKDADSETLLIVNDWKLFIQELLLSPNLQRIRSNLNAPDPNQHLFHLKTFLNVKTFESFRNIQRWTPFSVTTALNNISTNDLAGLFDEWLQCKQNPFEFPLLSGLWDIKFIPPVTMVQILLQSDLTSIFNQLCSREQLSQYLLINFASIYSIQLLMTQSHDVENQLFGRRVIEEIIPLFIDSEKMNSLLRNHVISIIAQTIVIGTTDWPNVVAALRQLAAKLKVSTASDFSELIHPLHAISIIPIVARNSKTCAPIIKLFQQVPLLQKYPQLLFLAYNQIADDQKDIFSQYAETVASSWKLNDSFDHVSKLRNYSFHEFILRYCDYVVWRTYPEAASKILFFMLNIVNRASKKVRQLNSFTYLEDEIVERLQMFDVQPSTRIFLSAPQLDEDSFDCPEKQEITFFDFVNALLWMVKSSSTSSTSEIIEIVNCCQLAKEDPLFAKLLLTFLFKTPIIEASKKLIVQKLSAILYDTCNGNHSSIWLDIIEAFPVKTGIVGEIFHFLPGNSLFLKYLIENSLSQGNFSSALYLYNLSLEQPRNRDLIDLGLLERIHSGIGAQDDYINVVKKRLRQFDSTLPEAWESKLSPADSQKIDGILRLVNKSLFVNRNVQGIVSEHERKFATWLYHLQFGNVEYFDSSGEASKYVKMLENVSRDRRTITHETLNLIQETLQEPSKLNFNVASVLTDISPKFEHISKFLQADITSRALWEKDQELAIDTSKYALSCFPTNFSDESRALLLCRIGEWNGQCKAERPSHIISNYLDKAMRIVEEKASNFNPHNLAHIHLTVARFIDEQYGQVTRTDELSRRSQLVAETRSSLESCRANLNRLSTSVSSDERIALERNVYELNQQYQADQEEYSKRLKDRNTFLLKSLTNYIAALSFGCKSGTEQISTISRICALWFQHHQEITANEIINSSIPGQSSKSSLSASIKTVPVRFYLPLIYQLAARATYNPAHSAPNEFQKVLLRLLVQMLLAHPFECIYQLLALRAGNQSEIVLSQAKRRRLVDSVSLNRDSEAEGRAAAAALVIDQVKKGSPQHSIIIMSIEQLCDAYIEIAKYNFSDSESKAMLQQSNPFPSNLTIKKLLYPLPVDSPFKNITIATCTSETVYFAGFVDRFRALRGINLPKLVEVISTTGSRHQQLVKGNDDVRQDAVMEQVFHRVNQLLKSDQETRKRNLSMRTYRVIPLRPLVGLLEFVPNSVTFSDYLKSAHERLRPSDMKPDECRLKLQTESDRAGSTVRSKLNVLVNEIGSRFKPVLRHFFFEHFQMSEWWPARQAYIRSMATSSILGWIVGLGDRHGMNILLDKSTGEVIHIDLNMIFEAGKALRIPERVPFRLTPDCVDGMGPEQLGLDGPFKQNAIAVLKLLRKERNALMMVLDVFKYDPLQKWTGMAAAAYQETSSDIACSVESSSNTSNSTFVTKAAERALLRIREKLEGREEGSILSESGHVSYLTHIATDPEMLCQMFYGWQAYF